MCFHSCDYIFSCRNLSPTFTFECALVRKSDLLLAVIGALGKSKLSLQKCSVWMTSRNEYLISLRSFLLNQSCSHSCPGSLSTPGRGSTAVWVEHSGLNKNVNKGLPSKSPGTEKQQHFPFKIKGQFIFLHLLPINFPQSSPLSLLPVILTGGIWVKLPEISCRWAIIGG